uniref:Selenoprotein F n=1 Tax=Scleropages formosus TaxID=113540 RepID=A0A8C9TLQ6_SCLFO
MVGIVIYLVRIGLNGETKFELFRRFTGTPFLQSVRVQALRKKRVHSKMAGEVYLLWLLSILQAISTYGAELSSEACRELGFSSNLLCSSCDLLSQFSLSQLDPFCRQCCQEEAQVEARKHYPGAILEVCG